jgi:hypothetical protein
MPISVTLTFELSTVQPSLTAMISNAVLERGEPFPLTVRSSSGMHLVDGAYRLMGDYLQDLYPAGTQYGFDWSFSTSTNGQVVWNGIVSWLGGHIWQVTISNLTLVPAAQLNMSQAGNASVQITWATNFADHVLEYTTSLPPAGWSTVTNAIATTGNRFSIMLTTDESKRFYRLRKP